MTVLVSGEVEHEHWDQFRQTIVDSARPTGSKDVVLDMLQVDFFDSGGIRALISARKALDADRIGSHINATSPPVQHLLETTGLDAYVPPFPTRGS